MCVSLATYTLMLVFALVGVWKFLGVVGKWLFGASADYMGRRDARRIIAKDFKQ